MMVWVWLGLLAFFVIVEAATANLLTIWFAAGSLVAFISSFFIENPIIQIVIFVIVSLIVLVALRPIAKKYTRTRKQPTNADMYINAEGVVTEAISNLNAKGTVKVRGSVWTARSSND
ncbi:MAG: NfeD family protein, partial [Clostridia bacterium]|nr:NfeD family protein [Clostridia bacterium]